MSIESEKDIEGLKKIGKIVAEAREEILKNIKPGISTVKLDMIGKNILEKYNATSAPKKDYNFPGYTCISINEEVAHGIPGKRIIKKGDIVNVDVSAELNGYYADTGATKVVDSNNKLKNDLCNCSEKALYMALKKVKAGNKISEIGKEIEREVKESNFKVIRNLCGHGIGKKLHEEPEYILNYYDPKDNLILKKGLVLAIETFVSNSAEYIVEHKNNWTLITPDKSFGAQFEHTIIVTDGEPIILTGI